MKKNDNLDPAVRRLKWVKKVPQKTDEPIKQRTDRVRQVNTARDRDREESTVAIEKLDDKLIEKECNDITNQRGQISKNPAQTVERLDFMITQTQNKILKIKILNLYILICFDTSPGQFSAISYDIWHKIHDSVLVITEHFYNLVEDKEENEKEALVNKILNKNNFFLGKY